MTDTSPTEYSYITPSAFGLTMDLVDKHPVQSPLVFLPGVFGLGVFGVQAMTLLMQMGAETEPVPLAFLFLGIAALLFAGWRIFTLQRRRRQTLTLTAAEIQVSSKGGGQSGKQSIPLNALERCTYKKTATGAELILTLKYPADHEEEMRWVLPANHNMEEEMHELEHYVNEAITAASRAGPGLNPRRLQREQLPDELTHLMQRGELPNPQPSDKTSHEPKTKGD